MSGQPTWPGCGCPTKADCDCDFVASMAGLQSEDEDEKCITADVKAVSWDRAERYHGGALPHHLVRMKGGKMPPRARTLCGLRVGGFARLHDELGAAELCERCKRSAYK